MSRIALDGKTAVVIGGTSGIGRTMSIGLAAAGANVVATGRRAELIEAVAGEIEAKGVRTMRQPTDVEDRASVQALHDAVAATIAPVDILINCAGRTIKSPTIDVTESDWHAVLETNLHGTLRACQVFGRAMIGRGYGRIINIASLSSFVGLYHVAGYAASKAAVASLTKSLAVEWARHGILVNAVAPGYFPTRMTAGLIEQNEPRLRALSPLGRLGREGELKGAVVFLCSAAASYVTGQVLAIDGGMTAA